MIQSVSRRQWLAVAALGASGCSMTGKMVAGDGVRNGIPLLKHNEGRWAGQYTFVTPNGKILDRHDFRIKIALDDEDSQQAYRQTTEYRWADGRRRSLFFEAAYEDGQLSWDDGRIAGKLWQVDERTLYLKFGFAADPSMECFEMIQMSDDRRQRGRSWLWYQGGKLKRYTLIDEHRERT